MEKKKIGADTYLYPMPTTIVGANVNGKANFLTIAYCGIVQHRPPLIAVALAKIHYTNAGIKENQTFSVNIPSQEMAKAADFVGIYSGRGQDKSKVFDCFYGGLKTAPMIKEAPLNLECRLIKALDFGGSGEIFIGEITEAYAKDEILTDGLPDIKKLNPIVFSMHDNTYWKVGDYIGKAWEMGVKPKDEV